MTDHTPTTEHKVTIDDLIDGWACEHMRADDRLEDVRDAAKKALATHNRKIAAEALREAAREMRGDGKRVLIDAEESADWLDNYADGFEQGGES